MSVPPNLNPDNISLRDLSIPERFMIMFGQPIPRCEFDVRPFLGQAAETACGTSFGFGEEMTFCPNCGSRIKFITK